MCGCSARNDPTARVELSPVELAHHKEIKVGTGVLPTGSLVYSRFSQTHLRAAV